jgi:hypothetical protein
MSEYGNEAATATMKIAEKSLEALMALIKWLMASEQRKLEKQAMKLKKAELGEKTAALKLDHSSGYKEMEKLLAGREPLAYLGAGNMTGADMKRFAETAKREGLVFSSVEAEGPGGEKRYSLIVRQKDQQHTEDIIDRMNVEKQASAYNGRIAELEGKKGLTEAEAAELEALKEALGDMERGFASDLNEENAEIIFAEAAGRMQDKSLSLDRALNRSTSRGYVPKEPTYAAERTNPDSYIKLDAARDEFLGQPYIKTSYTVYKDGQKAAGFTDERYEGRPGDYWKTIKGGIREAGGFSDDLVVFASRADLLRYQDLYMEEQRREIETLLAAKEDYGQIAGELRGQLEANTAALAFEGGGIGADALEAENIVIEKQIAAYERMAEVRAAYFQAKDDGISIREGSPEADESKRKLAALGKEYSELKGEAARLMKQRAQINGAQAAHGVDKEHQAKRDGRAAGREPSGNRTQSWDRWRRGIKSKRRRNAAPDGKPPEGAAKAAKAAMPKAASR